MKVSSFSIVKTQKLLKNGGIFLLWKKKEKEEIKKQNLLEMENGSLYYSETLGCWIFQYYDTLGKRQTMKQRKRETVKDFKARATKVKNELNAGTYISKSKETIVTIAEQHIQNKHTDGITSNRSYARDLETLEQIKKTCSNFCDIPIQNVTIKHLEDAKKEIRKYSNNTIDKIWCLLGKVFSIACSPSRKILIYNLMQDENLKKPISEKKTKKVKPLTSEELQKLNSILDNEERQHPYRNAVKMQSISGMRIGEVLARSKDDYNKETKEFDVHNTLTQDEHYRVILGEHTKTYNKKTQIDEGQRFLPLDNNLFSGLTEIIEEQCNKKIINIYNLIFWDYEKNTFITPGEVSSWLKRLNAKYKISKLELTTHRLRHTALTYWKEIGIDLSAIQYLAGHIEGSDITEGVYIETSLDFVKKEVAKIS